MTIAGRRLPPSSLGTNQNLTTASSRRRVSVGLVTPAGRLTKFVKWPRALSVSGFRSWYSTPTTGPSRLVVPSGICRCGGWCPRGRSRCK